METFLFMAILTMLVIAVISFIVLKKRWQFSIKLFLVGLIGFALPVMMIEGPINALVLSSFGHSSKWFTIILLSNFYFVFKRYEQVSLFFSCFWI